MNLDNHIPERNLALKKINLAFTSNAYEWLNLQKEERYTIVDAIERSCVKRAIKVCRKYGREPTWNCDYFLGVYNREIVRQCNNLDINSSLKDAQYNNDIIEGKHDPKHATSISSYRMNPSNTQEERDIIDIKRNQKVVKKYSNIPCKKCGEKKVSFVQDTGRSLGLDEITQTYYTCNECNHLWVR